ncbi:ABC transporter permease [Halorubellus litoreus]|uniref:ABC transporter permease n=1 Tax=Halorubellus litoreus TaxID=755308 RepID=A0ABD5VFI0_9EURY
MTAPDDEPTRGGGESDARGPRPDGGVGEVPDTGVGRALASRRVRDDGAASETERPLTGREASERTASTGRAASRREAVVGFARREYRVAARSRWPVGLAALFAAFTVGVVQYGASGAGASTVPAVVASVAALSTYVVPLAALAFGYATVVGPATRGELDVLYALPVPRWTVVVGAFAGRALTFTGAVCIGYAFGGAALYRVGGLDAVNAFLPTVAAAVLAGVAFLAIAVLVSTVAGEKASALGGVLLAWAWFVLVHDVVSLTAVVVLDLPASALAALVAANPADCLRVLGMAGVPSASGAAGALGATAVSVPVVVVALLAWITLALAAAARSTSTR